MLIVDYNDQAYIHSVEEIFWKADLLLYVYLVSQVMVHSYSMEGFLDTLLTKIIMGMILFLIQCLI